MKKRFVLIACAFLLFSGLVGAFEGAYAGKYGVECILSDVLEEKHIPSTQSAGQTYYTLSEEDFNAMFPFLDVVEENPQGQMKAFTSGRILDLDGFPVGTGAILDLDTKTMKVTGVSALHNFVNTDKGARRFGQIRYGHRFELMLDPYVDAEEAQSLGVVIIDDLLIQEDLRQDLCLFTGTLMVRAGGEVSVLEKLNEAYTGSSLELYEDLEAFKTHSQDVGSMMYHYPMGKPKIRLNRGKLFWSEQNGERHKVCAVDGSSGAAIVTDNDVILGIHTGFLREGDNVRKKTSVKYEGWKNGLLEVVNFNTYEIFTQETRDGMTFSLGKSSDSYESRSDVVYKVQTFFRNR